MAPLILTLALAMAGSLLPHGVIQPADGFGEGARLITSNGVQQLSGGPDRQFAQFIGQQLPASDRTKWYLTVYVDRLNDPESRLLLEDLDRHAALRQLKEWCKFQMVDRLASPSAEARYLAQELQQRKRDVPTLMLYANPDDPQFGRDSKGGWRYVYDASGYGGDADGLARNLYEAIRQEYKARGVPAGQCPGPYCPNPNLPNEPPNRPYQPTDPPTPRQDDWNRPPPPARPMDASPELPAIPWPYLAGAAAVGLYLLARRKGWLDPPGPGNSGVWLLAGLLALTVIGCRPPCSPGAEPDLPAVNRAVAPAAPIVDSPEPAPNAPCELAVIDRAREAVQAAVALLRTALLVLGGISAANLLVSLRILTVMMRRPDS